MVRNPPFSAGHIDLILGQRTKIPHAMGQLSWQAATTEASALERSSHTTVKSPCATTKTQCSQININNFFKNHRIFFEKVNDWYIDFWKLLAIRKYVPLMKTNLQDTFFPEQ